MTRIPGLRRAFQLPWRTTPALRRDIADELADHIERRTARLIAGGMGPEAAAAEARRRFGDIEQIQAECFDLDRSEWRLDSMRMLIDHLRGDLRFAIRSLRRSPIFAAVVIATLAVGIASVTSIFSYVYAFYWRPLPFVGMERMVAVAERRASGACCYNDVSKTAAASIIASNRSFARVTAFEERFATAVLGEAPRRLQTLLIDSSFAPTFGVRPQLGRLLSQPDIESNAAVAVISGRFWRAAFGSDSNIIGRRFTLGKRDLVVVGVMQDGFGFPRRTDVWLPRLPLETSAIANGDDSVGLIGTLRASVSRASAEAELHVIAARVSRDAALRIGRTELRALPEVLDRRANQGAPFPGMFIGAGLLVLLIAAANVMNLFLARTADRSGEIAVRTSMGATRWRLVLQLLTESLVLTTTAGIVGMVGAIGLMRVADAFFPNDGRPDWLTFDIDGRVLLFVTAIIVLVTIAVGLTPALDASGTDVMKTLKNAGDPGAIRRGTLRSARRGLTIQLALSVALFVAAGMFVRSYQRLQTIDNGYPAEQSINISYYFGSEDRDASAGLALAKEVAVRLASVPGHPRTAIHGYTDARLRGTPRDTTRNAFSPLERRVFADGDTSRYVRSRVAYASRTTAVSDDYFSTVGLNLRHGRTFSADDATKGIPVAVVSEGLASELWPRGNAIGGVVQVGLHGAQFTVVGVVQDARDAIGGSRGMSLATIPTVYFSMRQVEMADAATVARWPASITTLDATARAVVREVNNRVVFNVDPLANANHLQLETKVFGGVIATFAVSGMIVAIIGLYGLIAYGVAQRRREIGVRMAFGATRGRIISLIIANGIRFTMIGLSAGLVLSLGVGRVVQRLVFDVPSVDVAVYAVACIVFGGVALVASYIPALSAARVNPVVALKSE